jgi:hypothetical protein
LQTALTTLKGSWQIGFFKPGNRVRRRQFAGLENKPIPLLRLSSIRFVFRPVMNQTTKQHTERRLLRGMIKRGFRPWFDKQRQQMASDKYGRHIQSVIQMPKKMLWALYMEGVETTQMVDTFVRQGQGKLLVNMSARQPTPEELDKAREQLKDLPKFLPFFVLVIVPLPGVTEGYALMAVTLENWLGRKISLLPSQFRKVFSEEESGPL